MANEMNVEIRTLTPLWTGGIDGTMDRLHETGILGGLRWWYEAIVRGLGGYACEGPGRQRCELAGERLKKYEQARRQGKNWWDALDEAGMCDMCKVFGATGWRRRFRLRVVEAQMDPGWNTDLTLNVRPYGRRRGWYLPAGWMGELTLELSGEPETIGRLASLFIFLERWGSLGTKPQLGYGAFRLEEREVVQGQAVPFDALLLQQKTKFTLPNLRTMTFFQVRFVPRSQSWWENADGLRQLRRRKEWNSLQIWAEKGLVPISPTVKNDWRYVRSWPLPRLKPWLFGTLRRDYRLRSKVNIGWAIRQQDRSWLIKGWVWLPRDGPVRSDYISLVDAMRRLVEDESGWLDALNLRGRVRELQVEAFPSRLPWGVKKASLIRDWVNATLEETR